jgi:hypothetical protein
MEVGGVNTGEEEAGDEMLGGGTGEGERGGLVWGWIGVVFASVFL